MTPISGSLLLRLVCLSALVSGVGGCVRGEHVGTLMSPVASASQTSRALTDAHAELTLRTVPLTPFQRAIVESLEKQTAANTVYDSSYFRGGIPPARLGVCSDVAIRAFGAAGVDIKGKVTADIQAHRRLYPLKLPDPNIDHRRCRNLVVYFRRNAKELPLTAPAAQWLPGDIVFWSTGGKSYLDHIGVIGNHLGPSGNATVVQHLPGEPVTETDSLHKFQILHHFRWQ